MRKQVTFAESQTVPRLLRDEASPSIQMNQSKMALKDVGAVQIPKAMTAAPFLQHSALTPAQKEYLYSIAATYSSAHVRSLITQHYMNVLRRCVRAGGATPDRDGRVVTSEASTENQREKHKLKTQPEVKPTAKQKGKVNTRQSGKSFLPTIPKRPTRPLKTLATKHKKTKNQETMPQTLRRQNPTGARTSLVDEVEEDEDEDESLDDSLSDCLSFLSLGDWDDDDDSFSDL
ncbi:protein FAM216A-like isoform X2 [Parambassis ranga]|uniref:Protein FAM216A-like isoform X2 n=1 Tax=Parambassis ranga TaxID=210632 RepID=A0A6P7HJ81_9TELE|nr:protein FAM216A-like isoform X2 [Parambassis ranga]